MKTFDFVTFNQDDRSAGPYEYATEKEAIKNMHAWAKHCIDDEYIGRRLEMVYIDDEEYLDGLEDTERLLKKINQAKESIAFETTDGNYLEGTIWEHDTKQFIVHGAQYDNQNGDLRSFVKICPTISEAFQFIIDDFSKLAEAYKDDGEEVTIPTMKQLRQTKCAESPNTWPVWTKWSVEKI